MNIIWFRQILIEKKIHLHTLCNENKQNIYNIILYFL